MDAVKDQRKGIFDNGSEDGEMGGDREGSGDEDGGGLEDDVSYEEKMQKK